MVKRASSATGMFIRCMRRERTRFAFPIPYCNVYTICRTIDFRCKQRSVVVPRVAEVIVHAAAIVIEGAV